ncbi:LuxR family transcriptional regulator [Rhizobiaceae bacterium n13]|uniref:LuxR family transcriptional regulator n=1 Tax=Ferirhizobium litorale TaxID=2927786 RepID=A0AAE3QC91_9HYPH|nr:LuxR C-terminal-related transcriptional regulator [Fererhizobium litorale]MDI7860827.1 LuxR family transcriptional regulator [Fererhizobium litorale]MDI7920975.1 LuxR family transcriptional regulator [Fererhizobium litorale]
MISAERQSLLNAELAAATSRAAFLTAMHHVRSVFSLEHFSLFSVPTPNETLLGPHVLETTLPAELLRDFDRNKLLQKCPVIDRIWKSMLPVTWSLPPGESRRDINCPPLMRDLMQRFKLLMGISFPVNSIDGSRYFFSFDGTRAPFSQIEINELGMIVLQAFDVFDRLRRNELSGPSPLSARELEVVRWTAQGKTSVEIGQILSLSDHTVNAYMTNAIKKLDCVNRTQLVAKAIRLKLIS